MEKIKCAAIRIVKINTYTGKRHCDCFAAAKEAGEKYPFQEQQGFLTQEGRFVNRVQAKHIAEMAGQLLPRASKGKELFSEDIY